MDHARSRSTARPAPTSVARDVGLDDGRGPVDGERADGHAMLMPGPLEGTKVVELGFWVAGPATGGILSDWGADVIKIEPPPGDPFRGIFMSAVGVEVPFNPPFELDN